MLYTNNLTIISLWFRTKMNKSKWKSWQILWYSLIIIIYGRRYCSFFGGVIWPNYRFNSVSVHFQILCSRNWKQLMPLSCFTRPRTTKPVRHRPIISGFNLSKVDQWLISDKKQNNRQSYFGVHGTKRLNDRKWSFWFILNPFYTIFSP